MKLLYITALFPFAAEEQFFEPEIRELSRTVDVVVMATRPPGSKDHYPNLGVPSVHLPLLSPRVLWLAARETLHFPKRALRAFGEIAFGRSSLQARTVNLLVFPKALAVASEARRLGVDHVHGAWLTTPATIALVVWRMTGIPFSITAHQHDIFSGNLIASKAREARFIRAISARNCAHLREQLEPLLAVRCAVGHLGVDLPPRAPEPPARTVRILCAARLCIWKGHRYLLEALAMLRQKGIDFTCDLAGGGELREEVAAGISRLGLAQQVRMLGNVPHAELTASLARGDYDLFALASTERHGEHEGIPVAAMEAMAAGLPVVSTRTGSLPELVSPECGTLVEQCDAPALAAALEHFISDVDARRRAGALGRLRVVEEFETAATTRRLLSMLGVEGSLAAAVPGALR